MKYRNMRSVETGVHQERAERDDGGWMDELRITFIHTSWNARRHGADDGTGHKLTNIISCLYTAGIIIKGWRRTRIIVRGEGPWAGRSTAYRAARPSV